MSLIKSTVILNATMPSTDQADAFLEELDSLKERLLKSNILAAYDPDNRSEGVLDLAMQNSGHLIKVGEELDRSVAELAKVGVELEHQLETFHHHASFVS